MHADLPSPAHIKARRITGGAIVTVERADGRCHRYRVSLRRYNRLKDTLVVHHGTGGGWFFRHGFECSLHSVTGFADARRWVVKHDGGRAKHWQDRRHGR
ncbi:hypothetical protein [Cupriavidus metallidurans]|uniref:Uncharacterized protein n=1 Tax=Cupriavidus metallidurans TaxID=119219 RepID=A0A482ISR6_9BURK|nr:hypothetical protein [Cupriavidus metallidurans]QBP09830.1 hypothetical protein DDF84_008685 [Cupriavidus metallidurans]